MTRKIIYAALIFIFLLICLLPPVFYEILPAYISSDVLPGIAEQYGIDDFSGKIRHIGLTGAAASDIRIGAFAADSIKIDYSPFELKKKRIRRVQVSGFQIQCLIREDGISVQLPNIQKKKSSDSSEPVPEAGFHLPVFIDKFQIQSGRIIVEWQNRRYPIPFDLAISCPDPEQQIFNALISFDVRGRLIKCAVKANLHSQTADLHFESDVSELDRFSDFASLVPGLAVSGSVQISGDVRLQMNPIRMTSASAVLTLINKDSSYQSVKLRRHVQNAAPVEIRCSTGDGVLWKISASSVGLDQPVSAQISNISCQAALNPEGVSADGSFSVLLEQVQAPVSLSGPIPLDVDFSAAYLSDQNWRFRCNSEINDKSKSKDIRLSGDSFDASFKTPVFRIEGNSKTGKSEFSYTASDAAVRTKDAKTSVKIPAVSVKGAVYFKPDNTKKISGDFSADAPKSVMQADTATLSLPDFLVSGKWAVSPKGGLELETAVKVGKGSVRDNTRKIQADGIYAELPFFIPPSPKTVQGSFRIDAVTWNRLALGSVAGGIRQKGSEVTFEAAHKNKIFSDLTVKASGKATGIASGEIAGNIEITGAYPGRREVDLGKILPAAKGFVWNGILDVQGKLGFSGKGLQSSLRIKCSQSGLSDKSKEISAEGIEAVLFFPDLMRFASAPMQKLTFQKGSVGAIEIQDGNIAFQIESDGTLFIEKGSFKWCKGNVSVQSFRISPGLEDYDVVLYCDRVHLAQVLRQLGAGNAKGEGTVNGKIPVRYQNKKLVFNDGFLYSTPGEGGAIQITGTEIFTAGIPPDTPQYAQIDLAREALKEFDYTWAKLGLITQGDDLKLRLQFDGKPAKPLPFVYSKEIGGFSRVDAESPGSVFQGIRLDVNIGLPLDSIIRYRDIFKQFKP